jgi:tetratricopeptide (TPR) repeat protein
MEVDTGDAIPLLVSASQTTEKKRESLQLIHEELIRQVVFGDGLLAYRQSAYPILEPAELLANLRSAHAARPDLWQTWSVLVQHLADMHQRDEALTLAQQATERFPLVPRVWVDLAKVREARIERDETIPALERALQLSPSWSFASQQLADAYRFKGDFAAAKRVMEQAVANVPLDASNHGVLADLLWATRNFAEAIARAEHAARINPDYTWAWQVLPSWAHQHGEPKRAEALARELTKSRPGEAISWYRLAEVLPETAVNERLEALDRAIALNPRKEALLDARVVILTGAGRFDEALAACEPKEPGKPAPLLLQGRKAWIYAQKGDINTAIDTMRKVVADTPDYYWGWSQLMTWLSRKKQYKESLVAARSLARLDPRSAIPLGCIADLQMRLGERKEAFETLQRAFDLDPTYEFAGFTLFHNRLDSGSLAAAEQTLEKIELHIPGAAAKAARIALHAKRQERDKAFSELRTLCFIREASAQTLFDAAEACCKAGWSMKVERFFKDLLHEDGLNPEAGAQWVRLFTQRKSWGHRSEIYKLNPKTPIGIITRDTYISALGNQKYGRLLIKLIKRERDVLRQNTQLWGNVGFAYTHSGLFREAARWLADWRDRPDIAPWMLQNVATALRVCGRDEEALQANQRALELRGDHTTATHFLWVALGDAISGAVGPAMEKLAKVTPPAQVSTDRALYLLATAVTAVLTAPPENRNAIFREHKAILRDPALKATFELRSVRSSAKRAVAKMAEAAGAPRFRLGSGRVSLSGGNLSSDNSRRILCAAIIVASALLRMCARMDQPSTPPARDYYIPEQNATKPAESHRPRLRQRSSSGGALSLEPTHPLLSPAPFDTLPEPKFVPLPTPGPSGRE